MAKLLGMALSLPHTKQNNGCVLRLQESQRIGAVQNYPAKAIISGPTAGAYT